MRYATCTEVREYADTNVESIESVESIGVLRNGKSIPDFAPIVDNYPCWKHRKAQPLVLDGISACGMILEERISGEARNSDSHANKHAEN